MNDPLKHESVVELRARQTFNSVQLLLEYVIALFLVLFSLLTLYTTGRELLIAYQNHQNMTQAVSQGIDAVLFTVILLEVLNTIISRAEVILKLQEFLVIGIFSAIRFGLEIVAGAQRSKVESATALASLTSREIVIDLLINSGSVLVLVIALWFVKSRVQSNVTNAKSTDRHNKQMENETI